MTTHHEAHVRRLEHVLRAYGPLTRDTLYELAGADCWPDGAMFDAALDDGVASGAVRSLGGVLFEASDGAPATPGAALDAAATGR